MARISMLTAAEFPDALRDQLGADDRTPLELGNLRIYAHRPALASAYATYMAELRRPGLLSRRLVELVRLRVAFHNQCRSCMAVRYHDGAADGVDEALVCQLADPAVYSNGPKVAEVQQALDAAAAEVDRLYARWQALQDLAAAGA